MSVGVRGLRLGSGPRGTYVRGGRGGFYYQQYLHPNGAPAPGARRPLSSPPIPGPASEFVAEAGASGDAAIVELNRVGSAFRWSTPLLMVALLGTLYVVVAHVAVGWYILLLPALAYGAVLRRHETVDRALVLQYELDDDLTARYAALCAAFRTAARSARVWRILSELPHGDRKHNAGGVAKKAS